MGVALNSGAGEADEVGVAVAMCGVGEAAAEAAGRSALSITAAYTLHECAVDTHIPPSTDGERRTHRVHAAGNNRQRREQAEAKAARGPSTRQLVHAAAETLPYPSAR